MQTGNIILAGIIWIYFLLIAANIAERKRQSLGRSNSLSAPLYMIALAPFCFLLINGVLNYSKNPDLWLTTNIFSLIYLLSFLPAVRKIGAKLLSLDPNSYVHNISFSLSLLVPLGLVLNLVTGIHQVAQNTPQTSFIEAFTLLWIQCFGTVLLTFLGVGLLTRRTFKECLHRLGLYPSSWKNVLRGISFGLIFVVVIMGSLTLLEMLFHFGIDQDVTDVTDKLLGALQKNFFGILTLGLAAALGEELLFRGALLPKMGIIYSTLLFMFSHHHYVLSLAALMVLFLGFSLAYLRKRYDTLTTIFCHATYNIFITVVSIFSASQ